LAKAAVIAAVVTIIRSVKPIMIFLISIADLHAEELLGLSESF
jgi:hypothetical protein